MKVPDYGNGDWAVKHEMNQQLPCITDIGLRDSTVYMSLSAPAEWIRVTGQDHATLLEIRDTARIAYTMQPSDPYVRLTAYFPDTAVIYTNPFARYDASVSPTPLDDTPQPIDWFWTILFNLLILLLTAGTLFLLYLTLKPARR